MAESAILQLKASELIEPYLEAHFEYHQKLKYWTTVHNHDFYEIFLITEGTVFHQVNGIKQTLNKGDLVLIRPQDVHSYEKYGEIEVELLNINFSDKIIADVIAFLSLTSYWEYMLGRELPLLIQISSVEIAKIIARYAQIAAMAPESNQEIRTAVRAMFVMLLSDYFIPYEAYLKNPDIPEWLWRLQTEMQKKEHFTEGIEALYRLGKMSPEHLSRSIRRYFLKTPTEWINEMRIQYAASLLVVNKDEIVAIALECGINNLSHFYKIFHSHYQMSPGRYRSRNRRAAIPQ